MKRTLVTTCLTLLLFAPLSATAVAPVVTCTLTPDREALPAGPAQTVVVKVALDAPWCPASRSGRQ
jgi:hypothetical protein